jgi:hypothetical protein
MQAENEEMFVLTAAMLSELEVGKLQAAYGDLLVKSRGLPERFRALGCFERLEAWDVRGEGEVRERVLQPLGLLKTLSYVRLEGLPLVAGDGEVEERVVKARKLDRCNARERSC